MDWRPFLPVEELVSDSSVGRSPIKDDDNSPTSTNCCSQASSVRQASSSGSQSRKLKTAPPDNIVNHGWQKDMTNDSMPHPSLPSLSKAIHELGKEIFDALNEYHTLVQDFETAVHAITTWADNSTLDMIWINMIDKVFMKGKERQNMAEPVTTLRLIGCKQVLVGCLENIQSESKYTAGWDAKDQIRTGNKLIVHCSGIIDLSRRALNSHEACKYFVKELQEVMIILDPKSHHWINETSIKAGEPSDHEVTSSNDKPPVKTSSGENDLTDTLAPQSSEDVGARRKSSEENEATKDTDNTANNDNPIREPPVKDVQDSTTVSQWW